MIIIVGAGIAGLTLANYLEQSEQPYLLLEAAPELVVVGAGIMLQNNGLAILESLGLRDELKGQRIEKISLGYHSSIKSVLTEGVGLQAMCVHRAELQRVLLAKVPSENIKLNVTLQSVQQSANSVSVLLSDGTEVTGQYLVNAAGLHSTYHQLPADPSSFKQPPSYRNSGQVCWRTIVPLTQPITEFGEYWFGDQRVGFGPVSKTHAYLFHVVNTIAGINAEQLTDANRVAWIQKQTGMVRNLSLLNFKNAQWLKHPLVERDINWGHGRVLAIGDAAHALTPNLGQGAVLAMEDAAVLAKLFKNNSETVLADLKKLRHTRVFNIQKQSRLVGQFAHNQHLLMRFAKRVMFTLAPVSVSLRSQVRWMNQFINTLKT